MNRSPARRTHPFASSSLAHVVLLALAAAAVLLLPLAAPTTASAACAANSPAVNPASGKLEINLGNCVGDSEAWPAEYDSSVSQATFYPDFAANYWATTIPSLDGQSAHWEVRGSMPDARFSSFQSYTLSPLGETTDAVYDEEIETSPGSDNWIQTTGFYPTADDVRYSMPVVQTAASVPTSTLRQDPLSAESLLTYRVYANTARNGSTIPGGLTSQQWISRGQVALPELVYVIDDATKPHFESSAEIFGLRRTGDLLRNALGGIETVADLLAPVLAAYPEATDKLWSDPVNWEADEGLTTNLKKMINPTRAPLAAALWQAGLGALPNFQPFPNSASRYYVGGVNPGLGQVLITRFKAPTAPEPDTGDRLQPTSTTGEQVRYWSACLNNTITLYATGCLKDSQVALGADGFATIVASSTSTAPKGMNGQPAANWLRHGSPNELLLIRQTLAAQHFGQSISAFPGNGDQTTALAAHAGQYYPVSTYCSLNNYRYNDCRWKFSGLQEIQYALSPRLFAVLFPR